jgi:hypothetical protein
VRLIHRNLRVPVKSRLRRAASRSGKIPASFAAVGVEIRGQHAAPPVGDIGALGQDARAGGLAARLGRLGLRQNRHLPADHRKPGQKQPRQPQQPPLGATAGAVAHLFVAQADILALDGVGILAPAAGVKDTRQRAQRRADHGRSPSLVTSTGLVMVRFGAGSG